MTDFEGWDPPFLISAKRGLTRTRESQVFEMFFAAKLKGAYVVFKVCFPKGLRCLNFKVCLIKFESALLM